MIKKSGIITICGRPNVGKSTLTNAFVGEKVAIVTNKPQTTRNRICGIKNRGECQFVFVDTPGLHRARTRLGDYMVNVVRESVSDVDAVLLLVEPIPNVGEPEGQLIDRIKSLGCPAVLAGPGGDGHHVVEVVGLAVDLDDLQQPVLLRHGVRLVDGQHSGTAQGLDPGDQLPDRKSTRLNSSHA